MRRLTPLARFYGRAAANVASARVREHFTPGPARKMNLLRRIVRAIVRVMT